MFGRKKRERGVETSRGRKEDDDYLIEGEQKGGEKGTLNSGEGVGLL